MHRIVAAAHSLLTTMVRILIGKLCDIQHSHIHESSITFAVKTLLDFKAHITEDPYEVLGGWKKGFKCGNGWDGVCCDKSNRVTGM
jgi:hypothetical protein